MTENSTDHTKDVQHRVVQAISTGYDVIYGKLDALHKRGINDDDVIQALTALGEIDLLKSYAEWGEITLPDAEPTNGPVMEDVVPDPVVCSSYTNWSPRWVGPVSPLEDEFTGWDILRHIIEEFPHSYVEQTGGGTATLVIRKTEQDVAITAGPGAYNWTTPKSSVFYTSEFYFGRRPYDDDGNEDPDMDPGEALDPENPGTLIQLADRIRDAYTKNNPTEKE